MKILKIKYIKIYLTPDTKIFPASDGDISIPITSAWWPWNVWIATLLSISHNLAVLSPLAVKS